MIATDISFFHGSEAELKNKDYIKCKIDSFCFQGNQKLLVNNKHIEKTIGGRKFFVVINKWIVEKHINGSFRNSNPLNDKYISKTNKKKCKE